MGDSEADAKRYGPLDEDLKGAKICTECEGTGKDDPYGGPCPHCDGTGEQ